MLTYLDLTVLWSLSQITPDNVCWYMVDCQGGQVK